MSDAIIQAAMSYAARGWPVLPVNGKRPILTDWPNKATLDEDRVIEMWEAHPNANVGILCGAVSGVVDTGGNGPESDTILARIFGGAIPITVAFAGNRGPHRLFRWTEGLPGLARCFYGTNKDLELIPGNSPAQVVVPPSRFGKVVRAWVPGCSPDDVDLAEITPEALARFVNWQDMTLADILGPQGGVSRPPEHWETIRAGVPEGGRNDALASFAGRVLRDTPDLADPSFARTQVFILNQSNRPPLEEKEVETVFLSLLRKETARRLAEDMGQEVYTPLQSQTATEALATDFAGWHMVIIESDPPAYQIHAEIFAVRGPGFITVSAEEVCNGGKIRIAAASQVFCGLAKSFARKWDWREKGKDKQKPSAYEILMNSATRQPAPVEQHRRRSVALMALEKLELARDIQETEKPGDVETPVRLGDGAVIFKWRPFQREFSFGPEGVKQRELSEVMDAAGMTQTGHSRHKILTSEGLKRLAGLAGSSAVAQLEAPYREIKTTSKILESKCASAQNDATSE
jgi:hypothetical protein